VHGLQRGAHLRFRRLDCSCLRQAGSTGRPLAAVLAMAARRSPSPA
jgi:hypothetical protein